jgi:hypothetical protein
MNKLRLVNSQRTYLPLVFLFLFGLAVRLILIFVHPIVYGGDSVMRMMNADRVMIAYQLPFLQLLIFGANFLSQNPITIRYLMVLIGSLAGIAFYWLSSRLWGREVGLLCALFFVCNPFILVHSLVPYQEILMLLMLCSGLALLFESQSPRNLLLASQCLGSGGRHAGLPLRGTRNLLLASLCLGLACLTRYEAWIVTAAAAWFCWNKSRHRRASPFIWRPLLQNLLLFGWGPFLWLAIHQGLSPSGTFVLEGFREWQRLYRIPYVLAMTARHAGFPLLLLALLGAVEFWRQTLWKDSRLQMLIVATLALLTALLFSAHGVPPDPVRYVTDRESHWLMLPLFWAAGLGGAELKKWLFVPPPRYKLVRRGAVVLYYCVITIPLVWGLYETHRRLTNLTSSSSLQLDYAVAQYLDQHLLRGENALILAEPVPLGAIESYINRARLKGSDEGGEAARRIVADLDVGPFDYSRIAVNSRLGKSPFFHAAQLEGFTDQSSVHVLKAKKIRFVVLFATYEPLTGWESQLLNLVRQQGGKRIELTRMGQAASIFEIPD